MRQHVLTPRQKKIIEIYLESGIKAEGFGVLKWRVKNYLPTVETEIDLIKTFKEKAEIQ
jgi:hypothetical protein